MRKLKLTLTVEDEAVLPEQNIKDPIFVEDYKSEVFSDLKSCDIKLISFEIEELK